MRFFYDFFINPHDFFVRISNKGMKRWIYLVFLINIIITFLWEVRIAIPLGDYEINFSDNKFIDSFLSVLFSIIVFLTLAILLYILTFKKNIKDRLEKSFLVIFSLALINILGIITHASFYYFFGWYIKLHILFASIFLVQLAYLFIGLRTVFAISILRTSVSIISIYFVTGVIVLILLYPVAHLIGQKNKRSIIGEFAREIDKIEVSAGNKILHTADIFELRDNQQVIIESEIVWKISNEKVYNNVVGSIRLAEKRILDIYKTVLKQNLLFHLYTENGDLANIAGKKYVERIIAESNASILRDEFGLEIITLKIHGIESRSL